MKIEWLLNPFRTLNKKIILDYVIVVYIIEKIFLLMYLTYTPTNVQINFNYIIFSVNLSEKFSSTYIYIRES